MGTKNESEGKKHEIAKKMNTHSVKSYQPDQMYSAAAMKRFSAKRGRLGHND